MNVVLYVLDALRADHVSCYGYDRETTPTIDALAEDGVRFERCFTPATWTRPVAASLSSGAYPPTHDTQTRHDTFDPHVPALAEQFSSAGYRTVGITSMGNVSSAVSFDRGFDEFYDVYKDPAVIAKRRTSTATDEELKQESTDEVALPRAEDLNDVFAEWIEERWEEDRPFFAFIWSIGPHIPYDPPEAYRDWVDPDYSGPVDGERDCLPEVATDGDLDQLQALYDGEIAYNDACLNSLVELLEDEDVYDETLFAVAGDHGDAFEEHGRLTHGHAPYEELMHVPWVIRVPGDGVDEHVIDELSSLVDVYPTLLEYTTGVNVPDGVQGMSFADALDGTPVEGHEHVFSKTAAYDMQNTFYGVRSDNWKYIEVETPETSGRNVLKLLWYVLKKGIVLDILSNPRYYLDRYRYSGTEFLYDLSVDPGEQQNLVEERPEKREAFEQLLAEWHDACVELGQRTDGDRSAADIDEATKEQLRRLGYAE